MIQINKIRDEKGDTTANTMKSIGSLKKLENLEEMDKFLGAYGQPNVNQEGTNHINGSTASSEIEAATVSEKT
jgi:hypothetical protein